MNLKIKIFLLCPVPEDQKPINEYIQLKQNELTNWLTFSQEKYIQQLIIFGISFFLFFSIFRFSEFKDANYLPEWIFQNLFFTSFLLLALLLINFFRWKQTFSRLQTARLFYEEASWYDGQMWEKPFSILKNDKILSTIKIQKILERISKTSGILFFVALLCQIFLAF